MKSLRLQRQSMRLYNRYLENLSEHRFPCFFGVCGGEVARSWMGCNWPLSQISRVREQTWRPSEPNPPFSWWWNPMPENREENCMVWHMDLGHLGHFCTTGFPASKHIMLCSELCIAYLQMVTQLRWLNGYVSCVHFSWRLSKPWMHRLSLMCPWCLAYFRHSIILLTLFARILSYITTD